MAKARVQAKRDKAQERHKKRALPTSTPGQKVKGENFYTDAKAAKLSRMYKSKPDLEAMKKRPLLPARIEPSRHWFNNTRVVTQEKLEQFREALAEKKKDPRAIVVSRTKLPVSLFDFSAETLKARMTSLLTVAPYEKTFGTQARQKRPQLKHEGLDGLVQAAAEAQQQYATEKDVSLAAELREEDRAAPPEAVMLKGTSKRIWGECYKVIDSSDIILQVLDVRDPQGTRCRYLETHLRKDRPNKRLVLILNKCDLVPEWVTEKWIKILKADFPVVAFKASMKHPFGKRSLIGVIRQLADGLQNRKHVSVGLVGYPNVGKSSVINTLRGKKVCSTAPIPGQTKVWQYVELTSRVYLIDSPGIVAAQSMAHLPDIDKVVRGIVRGDKIETPQDYIQYIVEELVGKRKFHEHYKIPEDQRNWTDVEDVLEYLAQMWGRLGKGGEPQINIVAVKIINDVQRGVLPWFKPPPFAEGDQSREDDDEEGRDKGRKRRRLDATGSDDAEEGDDTPAGDALQDEDDDEQEEAPEAPAAAAPPESEPPAPIGTGLDELLGPAPVCV